MTVNQQSKNISVIIPVGPNDEILPQLIKFLRSFGSIGEFIVVATRAQNPSENAILDGISGVPCKWVISAPGRSIQLNLGAEQASGEWLWFVHADSGFSNIKDINFLKKIDLRSDTLYFFDLLFDGASPQSMRLNEIGVWIRSNWLKMPFGDQALLISTERFRKIGGFDTKLPYGEDHVLVWRMRQLGGRVQCIGQVVHTSARKYVRGGWWRTTVRHLWLTFKQAFPEFIRLVRGRVGD